MSIVTGLNGTHNRNLFPDKGILKLTMKCVGSPNIEKIVTMRNSGITSGNLKYSPTKYSPMKKPRLDRPSANGFQEPVIVDLQNSSPLNNKDQSSPSNGFYKSDIRAVASVTRKLLMTPDKTAPQLDIISPRKTVSLTECKVNIVRSLVPHLSDSHLKRKKAVERYITSSSESDGESEFDVGICRSLRRATQVAILPNENARITRSVTKRERVKNMAAEPTKSKSVKSPVAKTKPTSIYYESDFTDTSDDVFSPSESEDDDSPSGSEDDDSPRKSNMNSATKSMTKERPKSRSKKSVSTPKIPNREKTVACNRSPLNKLQARLRPSTIPDALPGREKEFASIHSFVQGKMKGGIGGCMYISGVPGTGKTATVTEVIRVLRETVVLGKLTDFKFVSINGMKLTDPRQAYVQIVFDLMGEKVTKDHAMKLLKERFSKPSPKHEMVIMMVDELDLLWTRKQDVLYSLVDWTSHPKSRLIVLAIANTMDLPERMMNKVSSRVGLTRITFRPYNFTQLQEIIGSRIGNARSFHADAVQLISRKVAALSGDARRALEVSRRATEIAEMNRKSPQKGGVFVVGIDDAKKAFEEMITSPNVAAIRNASIQEKLFLRAVVYEIKRTEVEEVRLHRVSHEHISLCLQEGYEPPNSNVISRIVARLTTCGLMIVENEKSNSNVRVRLKVSIDDVTYALQS